MADDPRPLLLGPNEGRFIDLGDFGMTAKADIDETGVSYPCWRRANRLDSGRPHVHHDDDARSWKDRNSVIQRRRGSRRAFRAPGAKRVALPRGERAHRAPR